MRIIAGEFRGRKLLPPEGEQTRPITDRVKQSLFDILTPILPDARVYDCFAGTGSLGLEALSRGSAHVTFFESDRSAAARLRRNIEALGVKDRSTVHAGDLFQWFENRAGRDRPADEGSPVDLVFLDPPYRFVTEKRDRLVQLAQAMASGCLGPTGTIVFRHDARDELALPPFAIVDKRSYGGMAIELLALPAS